MSSLDATSLSHISAFSGLKTATLDQISHLASSRRFDAGAEAVGYLEGSNGFYVIVAGTARVRIEASNGRILTYQLLFPGDSFGEVAAWDGAQRTASVVAETECHMVVIPPAEFHKLMVNHPDFAAMVMDKMVRTHRWLTARLFEYHAYDVRGRIYSELLRQAEESESGVIALTDRDLATRVGTTRENVTRIHGKLKKDGIIERNQSSIRILDGVRLQELLADSEFT
ncbi:MAG: CRP/FNR family cyclic AMP-dependent transcriptional regulator [Limisphaerales bacterium]|jgi:CRP/FNR family cyclic AMP-dependent transcriptional regulator